MMLQVVGLETVIRNPQSDRNRSNRIVDPRVAERMAVNCFVLHAEVPCTKHAQKWNGQPRCQYFVPQHSKHREAVDRYNHGDRAPLTPPIEQ